MPGALVVRSDVTRWSYNSEGSSRKQRETVAPFTVNEHTLGTFPIYILQFNHAAPSGLLQRYAMMSRVCFIS